MITNTNPQDELFLRSKIEQDPSDWESRQLLAIALYNKESFEEAADIIWKTEQIPSTDLDLSFAARILSKAQPRRAIRLLAAVIELNQGKALHNMGMANALLHHGMVLQAARFYGAALDADPTLVNPELEHFILWTDDELTLWGKFENRRPKLGELPWMVRDPKEALMLTQSISLHSTPISIPNLPSAAGEELQQEFYVQEAKLNGKITPPPAVTIPIDRVDPKYRLYDSTYGADVTASPTPTPETAAVPTPVPVVPVPVPVAPVPILAPAAVAPVPLAPPPVLLTPAARAAAPVVLAVPLAPPAPLSPPVPLTGPAVVAIPEGMPERTIPTKKQLILPGAGQSANPTPTAFAIPKPASTPKAALLPPTPPTRPPRPPGAS